MGILKRLHIALVLTVAYFVPAAQTEVHVWETQELTFNSSNSYNNAYTDVKFWIDLKGPGFDKRVYGFWDGGNIFRVRFVATKAGMWNWKTGSDSNDAGLSGKTGSLTARDWTEKEKMKTLYVGVSLGLQLTDMH